MNNDQRTYSVHNGNIDVFILFFLYGILLQATCNIRPGSNNHSFRWLFGTGQVLSPGAYTTLLRHLITNRIGWVGDCQNHYVTLYFLGSVNFCDDPLLKYFLISN